MTIEEEIHHHECWAANALKELEHTEQEGDSEAQEAARFNYTNAMMGLMLWRNRQKAQGAE